MADRRLAEIELFGNLEHESESPCWLSMSSIRSRVSSASALRRSVNVTTCASSGVGGSDSTLQHESSGFGA